jgi:hypothetical protein
MIMDNLLLFDGSVSSAGALSGTTITSGWANPATPATYTSANTIDTSQIAGAATAQGRDIGIGDDPALLLLVTAMTAITGSANSTLQIALAAAPDGGSGTPGSFVVIAQSPAYAVGTGGIAAGTELFRIPVPASLSSASPKFYQVQYIVGTANISAGSVLATIILDREGLGPNLAYQQGIPAATLKYM